jgi:lysophospholipid acyltransferase (LPLAT)-like uncharacterized protein
VISESLKVSTVAVAGSLFLSTLGATLRLKIEGAEHLEAVRDRDDPFIYVLWHSRLLPLVHLHRNEGVMALASSHRDGEYIARVMMRRGFVMARGSSTRGGARGLRELIRGARAGRDLAVTVDGPRGPARVAKMGAVTLARATGLPLLPISAGGSHVWRARSWDRFEVPRPFSRVRVRYAAPIFVPREAEPEELENLRLQVEQTLNLITDEVDGAMGTSGPMPDESTRRDSTR